MSISRAKQARRKTVAPKAGAVKPANNAVRRKKRTAQSRPRVAAAPQVARRTRKPSELPGWNDLATRNERVASRPPVGVFMDKVSTVRFGLLLLAVVAVVTLYVGHVQATQDALVHAQEARRENLRLHLKLDRLKGDFDRATGPAVIYQRARALGLEEGITYGPTIKTQRTN